MAYLNYGAYQYLSLYKGDLYVSTYDYGGSRDNLGNSWNNPIILDKIFDSGGTLYSNLINNSTVLVFLGSQHYQGWIKNRSDIGSTKYYFIFNHTININNITFRVVPEVRALDGIYDNQGGQTHNARTAAVTKLWGTNRSQVFDNWFFSPSSSSLTSDSPIFYGITFKNCLFYRFPPVFAKHCTFINCVITPPPPSAESSIDYSNSIYMKDCDYYNCHIDTSTYDDNLGSDLNFKYFIYNNFYGEMFNCRDEYLKSEDQFIEKYNNVYAIYNYGVVNHNISSASNCSSNLYAELIDKYGCPRIYDNTVDAGSYEVRSNALNADGSISFTPINKKILLDPSTTGDNFTDGSDYITFKPLDGVVSPWEIYFYENSSLDYLPTPYAGNNYLFLYWCVNPERTSKVYRPKDLNSLNQATNVNWITNGKIYAKYIPWSYVTNIEIRGSDYMYSDETKHYDVYVLYGSNKYKLNVDTPGLTLTSSNHNSYIFNGDLSVNTDWFELGGTTELTATLSGGGGSSKTANKTVNILIRPIKILFDSNLDSTRLVHLNYKEYDSYVYSELRYNILPGISHKFLRFLGWYTSPTGGSKIVVGTIINRLTEVLYAHWSEPTQLLEISLAGEYSRSKVTTPAETGEVVYNFESYNANVYLGLNENYSIKLKLKDSSGVEWWSLVTGSVAEGYWFDEGRSIPDHTIPNSVVSWQKGDSSTSYYDIMTTNVDKESHTLMIKLSVTYNSMTITNYPDNRGQTINLLVVYDNVHFDKSQTTAVTTSGYISDGDFTSSPYIYPTFSDSYLRYLLMNPFSVGTKYNSGSESLLGLPMLYVSKNGDQVYGCYWKLDNVSHDHTSDMTVKNDTVINDEVYLVSWNSDNTEKIYDTYLVPNTDERYLIRLDVRYKDTGLVVGDIIYTNGYEKNIILVVYTNDFKWNVLTIDDESSMLGSLSPLSGLSGTVDFTLPIKGFYEGEGLSRSSTIQFKTQAGGLIKSIQIIQSSSNPYPDDDKYFAGAYVDCYRGVDAEGYGTKFSTPFKTIQYAIEHVPSGYYINGVYQNESGTRYSGSVIVNDGIYRENIDGSDYSNLTYVRSVNGPEYTFIDGSHENDSVVTNVSIGYKFSIPVNMDYIDDWTKELTRDYNTYPGFTIRNSNSSGVLYNTNSNGVISNSIISYNSSGIINSSSSKVLVLSSIIYNNTSTGATNCILLSDIISKNEIGCNNCNIYSCLIFKNNSIGVSNSTNILDSTIVYNGSYGVSDSSGILNSIIYYNGDIIEGGTNNFSNVNEDSIKYSCIFPLVSINNLGKNTRIAPVFENIDENDYHLKLRSPLVNNRLIPDEDLTEYESNIDSSLKKSKQAFGDLDKIIYYVYASDKYPKNVGCYQHPKSGIYKKYRLLPKISVPNKEVD